MRELFDRFERVPLDDHSGGVFVDTCFFLDELRHHRDEEVSGLSMLSFNAEELAHVAKRLPGGEKKHVRSFLKRNPLRIVDVPVSPGERGKERRFVDETDPDLLRVVRDPSDAVLLAAALQAGAAVLTKDKHHLFKAALENREGVRVFKEYKDYLDWARHHRP